MTGKLLITVSLIVFLSGCTLFEDEVLLERDYSIDSKEVLKGGGIPADFVSTYTKGQMVQMIADSNLYETRRCIVFKGSFRYSDIYSIIKYSDEIIEGKVVKMVAKRKPGQSINTFIYLDNVRRYKNKERNNPVVIQLDGGKLGNVTLTGGHYQGSYEIGEEIFLLGVIGRTEKDTSILWSEHFHKFRVIR